MITKNHKLFYTIDSAGTNQSKWKSSSELVQNQQIRKYDDIFKHNHLQIGIIRKYETIAGLVMVLTYNAQCQAYNWCCVTMLTMDQSYIKK